MFARLMKYLVPLALVHCISARLSLFPNFYGQDSAIIVDTDRTKMNPKLHNALYYNIPVYKLIKPGKSVPTVGTRTTTAAPVLEQEYPSDLLHIARHKLGLRRTEQLPSLSQLGELLGTGNAGETVKYIRNLVSNEQGIALMKAYLHSLDYAESETENDDKPPEEKYNEYDNDTDNVADYDEVPPKLETTTTAVPQLAEEGGLMQRVNDFMQKYGMWSGESTTPRPVTYQPVFVAPVQSTRQPPRPVLVRQPLPYHYPIPLRPVVLSQSFKTTAKPTTITSTTAAPQPPHLNTPKATPFISSSPVAPHVQQLAEIANISPAVLDQFLQQQPKLAELAKRVSRLPLVQQHSKAIDSQLFVAVKKALSQDENLKRLLGAAETLQ